ncbi:MAG: hypothetical protein WED34_04780 [Planctomycetales bacterium]
MRHEDFDFSEPKSLNDIRSAPASTYVKPYDTSWVWAVGLLALVVSGFAFWRGVTNLTEISAAHEEAEAIGNQLATADSVAEIESLDRRVEELRKRSGTKESTLVFGIVYILVGLFLFIVSMAGFWMACQIRSKVTCPRCQEGFEVTKDKGGMICPGCRGPLRIEGGKVFRI